MTLEISDFDLQSVVSDTINILSYSARKKGLKLTLAIDTEVPSVFKGDACRLRQIVTNLVGNAVKFAAEGEVTLHIQKDSEDEQTATLRFTVCDSGIGIAAEKLEHIFQPFTQGDSSTTRSYGGTGLGLAICKQLVELMGGMISVESVEGEGTTFWFTAVLEKGKTVDSEHVWASGELKCENRSQIPHNPNVVTEGASSNIRILLTDDDPTAQKIVPKLLKIHGYMVDVASDGKEALRALEANDYALVLMDCMMPEMSGYEVTAIIRDPSSAVRRHDIPIVALTGNAMKHDRDECIVAGMDDHLPKPLMLPDLLAMLAKWTERGG